MRRFSELAVAGSSMVSAIIHRDRQTWIGTFGHGIIALSGDSVRHLTSKQGLVDDRIQSQVESVIARASDLPTGLMVEVNQGVVSVSGSLDCENCGGMRTPNNLGTIQQSLGAMVRAVPGVTKVEFSLTSDS